METTNDLTEQPCNGTCRCGKSRDMRESGTQTDTRIQGHGPRLSKVNLFTLLSLWMELYPKEHSDSTDTDHNQTVRGTGLVVVRDGKVLGLHCSGPEVHAGQVAVIRHGTRLAGSHMYFSRRPCASCLKMIINAGVGQISFWPGDPEVSMLRPSGASHAHCPKRDPTNSISLEAELDALATEKLKSNSRPPICVLLQPLVPGMAQFVDETSRGSDFMARVQLDEPSLDTGELFGRQRRRHLEEFSTRFLVGCERCHRDVLDHMGLENFCVKPYLSSLRHNMRDLVGVLATVAAGVPLLRHGFYRPGKAPGPCRVVVSRSQSPTPGPSEKTEEEASSGGPQSQAVSQEVARHCIIQARLLSYRTEDHKVGVGAVIWAEGQQAGCDGTGRLYLVGCGCNAYPAGSQYGQYPQLDTNHQVREKTKYRYIIHAEQNALTFRSQEIRAGERIMLFVTMCPCDECVPLIKASGITHIYTTDQRCGKDKGEISYLRFSQMQGVNKFTWQQCPAVDSAASPHLTNGCVLKRPRGAPHDRGCHDDKRPCLNEVQDTPAIS